MDAAISKYADLLRDKYALSSVAPSDKFPPTTNMVFIKLALVKKEKLSKAQDDKLIFQTLRGDIDKILEEKEPIEMDDILKADDKIRLVVVEGAPGIGKSTLAWELCRQWRVQKSLKQFSLVVLLRLREEGVRSATDLSDFFPCGDYPSLSRLVAQKVKADNGEGVLFVFDGFDEFPSDLREKSHIVIDIIKGSKLPKATVLVTSRPSASAQLQALLQTSIDKHIEVVGFSEKEIFEFAESIFGNTDHFSDFKAYLKANPVVKGMMYNPLNCRIVVGVYQHTYELGKPVPRTETQLYTKLTHCLLLRYLKDEQHPLARRLPDNLEALSNSDLYQQLVKVGKFAFKAKLREQVIFEQLPEGCSDLGILVKHTSLYTGEESTTYNFFHLTLQEYMSAFYISQLPADEQKILFSEHNSTSMDVVWRFVAGLTKMRNIGWSEVMRVKEEEWLEPTKQMWGVGIKLIETVIVDNLVTVGPFIIQCLYEAQDMQSFESVFGQHIVQFNPNHRDLLILNLFALGYCISVCSNTWHVTMWDKRREGLEMLRHGMNSVDYGGGYIEKLDLFGSRGIMNESNCKYLLQIPDHILQQIEELNLAFCDIDQRGFENLAECIPYLPSLTLLNIHYNPGGDGSLVKLFQVLREHGKLQTLHVNVISIGMDDVAALAGLVKLSSSLRKLVVGGSWSGLQAGEVANQLVKTVLLPSSLREVLIFGCEFPLDGIEAISDNISSLTFENPFEATVKSGTKLSHILRDNTSLKELKLFIPLDKDEVHDIIDSLKDNHSLERLELSKQYHSQYFSESEKQALDTRISLANP